MKRTTMQLRLVVVPVIGILNADGLLIGEETAGEIALYYPYTMGDSVMGLAERAVQKRLEENDDAGQE